MKGKTHDLNHDLTFYANIINCVCHSIRSMFRVLGMYNFAPTMYPNNFQILFLYIKTLKMKIHSSGH